MKRFFVHEKGAGLILLLVFSLFVPVKAQEQVNVTSVDFRYQEGQSRLEIGLSQEATFSKSESVEDNQVILDIAGANISESLARKLDTSSFKSNVTLISPYQSSENVRVVFQLKEPGDVNFSLEGNKLVALIDNNRPASPDIVTSTETAEEPIEEPIEPIADATEEIELNNQADDPESSQRVSEFLEARETKKYKGKKITLQMRGADLKDVFRAISEASDFNIVLSDFVKGGLTLNLTDVPWDQALDIILQTKKLTAERNGNVLRVTTIDALTKEKEAELQAKKAAEATEPLVVKIFPISYAKIEDVQKILEDFLSNKVILGAPTRLGQGDQQKRGSIQIDSRTNSLVIRDIPSTMSKIEKILKELDTQTPQVLIEAKFVEVKERSQKTVEGRIFATSREFDSTANQFSFNASKNNFGALFSGDNAGDALPDSFAITPVSGASFGFSPKAGLLPGFGEIAAFLSILETESSAKIIASPRIVTRNKEPAQITQGQTIQLATTPGANSSGGFTTVNAVLKLEVTPQVTNDGAINVKITFSQEAPSAQSVAGSSLTTDTKKVDTAVLVDSGATLVIGGIYSNSVNKSEAGIPILRDLPIIGVLFGSKSSQVAKDELFIFITPRILNEKEAGLRG